MADASNIEIIISLVDSDLDDQEKNQEIEELLKQIQELEGVEEFGRVPDLNVAAGSKSVTGYLVGKLKAVIKLDQIKEFFGKWTQYITQRTPIEVEAEANGKKIKVKANSPSEIEAVVTVINDFVNQP